MSNVEHRFWSKVEKTDTCWIWIGGISSGGYGAFHPTGRSDVTTGAHQFSWLLHYGPIPLGMDVCHTCDNTVCVRPDHLFLGTDKSNRSDAASKGRVPYGEWHWASVLSASNVAEIRQRFLSGETS